MSESFAPLFHVLDPRQFDRARLDELCTLTTRIRQLAKARLGARALQTLLPHKRGMLYFTQPSTRTYLSFENACHLLGIRTAEIRDPSTSSEFKGESFEDSLRTFSSYVDVIIMRTRGEGLARHSADLMDRIRRPVPIINAGSGKDAHPTQALLDIYTLERSFEKRGGIDGKTIGLMGDLRRGRTARSLSYLMERYRDVRLVFIAPDAFQMGGDLLDWLSARGVTFSCTDRLHEALGDLDALYVTRLQKEYDTGVANRTTSITPASAWVRVNSGCCRNAASSCTRFPAARSWTPASTTTRARCTGARSVTACGSGWRCW